jgi:hypothetical protein
MDNKSSFLWKKLKIAGFFCLLATMILAFSGCASIVSHSDWPISIRSTPDQADVTVTDVKEGKKIFQGKTPTKVTLSSYGGFFSGKYYMVDISKQGFETKTVEITSPLNGWYVGNIIFGGLIGILIVDPLTGAMWTLSPKEIDVTLANKIAEVPTEQKDLSVVDIKNVPTHLQDKMIRIK